MNAQVIASALIILRYDLSDDTQSNHVCSQMTAQKL